MKDLIYVDPLLWIFYGAIIASLIWIAVLIIVAQIYRDRGREDVLEERRVEFKKTTGARRIKHHNELWSDEFAKRLAVKQPKSKKGLNDR